MPPPHDMEGLVHVVGVKEWLAHRIIAKLFPGSLPGHLAEGDLLARAGPKQAQPLGHSANDIVRTSETRYVPQNRQLNARPIELIPVELEQLDLPWRQLTINLYNHGSVPHGSFTHMQIRVRPAERLRIHAATKNKCKYDK
eukprot:CAMPEP_0170630246 /NCGR_PEP_ID=MMETSP0224-20130122/33862_1 /TAXON_ID=285029 /ORGANISM="Togula jolla, Strain CCCM 725" /LENGTH=140 /DNA_ID=CAMNT_0010958219 /DNA_START=657 /DNA_END=1079 /DNA_ORIENTATION=-